MWGAWEHRIWAGTDEAKHNLQSSACCMMWSSERLWVLMSTSYEVMDGLSSNKQQLATVHCTGCHLVAQRDYFDV